MNWSVLLRTYTMIGAVTVVSLYVFAQQFSDARLSVSIVAVATIAFVSVVLGALLAINATIEGSEPV